MHARTHWLNKHGPGYHSRPITFTERQLRLSIQSALMHPLQTRLGVFVVAVVRRYIAVDAGTRAAGIALFVVVAMPGLLVSLAAGYGLLHDDDVWARLVWLRRAVPEDVASFVENQLVFARASAAGDLSLTAVFGVLFAIVGGERAVASAIITLNRINHVTKERSFARRHALAIAITTGGLLVAIVDLLLLVALPALADTLGWRSAGWTVLLVIRWPAALALLTALLAVFFRIGPNGAALSWRSAVVGAVVAASIWSIASWFLSVAHIQEGRVYGTAAGLVVILLWFYVSSVAVLVGACVSAEMQERAKASRVDYPRFLLERPAVD